MKRNIFLLLLLTGFVNLAIATVVTPTTAKKVAKNHYLTYSGLKNSAAIELNLSYTEKENGEAVYYVFNVNDNDGFVIIAADDNVYPVLGYSFEGSLTLEPGFDATNFNYWMNNYKEQIVYARDNSLKADAFISSAWESLIQDEPQTKSIESVDPLLTTTWDQGCYYNELCPSAGGGACGHVYTGCVATAMAQIMKYHDFPPQGTGSHSYNCPGYGTQSANFGATTYDWSSMPNSLYSSNTAVATLMYHCGVSVDMQYSTTGSGAFSGDARDALVNYFNYSSNAHLFPKSSFPIDIWEDKLKNELVQGRPVYYDGSGSAGGHAFVCDGFQGTNHFHFNWGWSGYANGYFYLNNLNPGGYQFNQNQDAILYIYPEGTQVLESPQNFTAEVIDGDVHLAWDPPAGKALLGYNVYRNNSVIEYTTETQYVDLSPAQGSYTYYICAVYDEGESFPTEMLSVFIGGGTTTVFEDSFDSYTAGQQVACQNSTDWTTWDYTPCSSTDAYVSSDVAHSGNNSALVEGVTDLVKIIDNYSDGLYKISFYMYVPSGYLGYFNTLQLFNGQNSEWGMQVYFDEGGQGTIDGGGQAAASFSFPNDTWMLNEIVIDLTNDWAEYKLDGTSIHGWQWSIGAFGQGNLNQIGGVDFYAWTGNGKGTPKYYFDDFMIEEYGGAQLMPPLNFALNLAVNDIQLTWDEPSGNTLLGYNIYYSFNQGNFDLLANTDETSYIVESPGPGLHSYYLTAVYEEGESDPTDTLDITLTGNDDFIDQKLKLYPNPAKDLLSVSAGETINSIKILNLAGQTVMEVILGYKNGVINISQLDKGVYFAKVITESGSTVNKFIKE